MTTSPHPTPAATAATLRPRVHALATQLQHLRQQRASTPAGHETDIARLDAQIVEVEQEHAALAAELAALLAPPAIAMAERAEKFLRGPYREHARALRDGIRENVHEPAGQFLAIEKELRELGYAQLLDGLRVPGQADYGQYVQRYLNLPDLESRVPFWGRLPLDERASASAETIALQRKL